MNTGTRLGPYEILAPIGAGGMGEVYRARDPRLGRDVAVKISKQQFTERFEREARAVAALNHPHICQIYDVGPDYIVMELVDGVPLKGPLPVAKAIDYAGQILDALDAAHRKGITHRDLKPANILVTKQGIKLLDFGLAKQSSLVNESDATGITGPNQILGTLQYMSPEQLQGKEADARSDLFSFGCVLYEMLSGKQAFAGSSNASVIAAVLEREPAPLNTTPPLDRVIKRCLAKDPDDRFQTARDLKTALRWATEKPAAPVAVGSSRLWWIAPAVLVTVAMGGWSIAHWSRQPAADVRPLRLSLNPPEGGQFISSVSTGGGIALSPDGRYVAFVASVGGKDALWLHPLDGTAAKPLPGTEGASQPFWSPDSRSLGFFAAFKLLRIDLAGASPQVVCEAPSNFRGGAWGSDGLILIGRFPGGVSTVSAEGGLPSPLTGLDPARGETGHLWPQVLPNGRFLYFARSDKAENSGVYGASLARPRDRIRLLAEASPAIYSASGYLLWARGTALMTQRFDARALTLAGAPEVVANPVGFTSSTNSLKSAVSDNGLLLYSDTGDETRLRWIDRSGKVVGNLTDAEDTANVRVSLDGLRGALMRVNSRGGSDLWLTEWSRGTSTRFTFTAGIHARPVWSPDGLSLMYTGGTALNLYRKATSGAGNEVRLTESRNQQFPTDWSRDGRLVLFYEISPETNRDIWVLPLTEPNAKPRPYVQTPFDEREGRFSPEPNPRWVAYQSNETGRYEIFIQAFPEPRAKFQISTGGGQFPHWGPGGREIYYIAPDNKLITVSLKLSADSLVASPPQPLFALPPLSGLAIASPYEADPAGQRFLVLAAAQDKPTPLNLIVNWTALLKKGAAGQ